MAIGDAVITIVGRISRGPELKYTGGGKAMVVFQVTVTPRSRQGDRWINGDPSYYQCVAWEALGENLNDSLANGDRVLVHGTWAQGRTYEDSQGVRRTPWELRVEAIGPDLRYTTARVQRMDRASQGAAPAGGSADDPWATAPK
jgi:single-strand DNA-binding protein